MGFGVVLADDIYATSCPTFEDKIVASLQSYVTKLHPTFRGRHVHQYTATITVFHTRRRENETSRRVIRLDFESREH